jgi:Uma2 family endonuclease
MQIDGKAISNDESTAWATRIAQLFPPQGHWGVDDYLRLTDLSRGLVEFDEGTIEVLEMPTERHQLIVQFLFLAFHRFVSERALGTLVFAPIRVETIGNRFREPDLAFMLAAHASKRTNDYWRGADLVVEVVSEDVNSRRRDLETKRVEYARAGIREYWIVDPREQRIEVLSLGAGGAGGYELTEEFIVGQTAVSRLLDGLQIDVGSVFEAGKMQSDSGQSDSGTSD